jgi:hypothetical protein
MKDQLRRSLRNRDCTIDQTPGVTPTFHLSAAFVLGPKNLWGFGRVDSDDLFFSESFFASCEFSPFT